ncbi:hypothetical protein MtrunA17_Chr2g0321771 [Medicago truncatula]|uniref:GIR1-like zinc ribbon domain-containing protein n=1 Tax=Medicago truncatula TaxID=3880 RepID=G7IHG8_MEDTR|nr:hypothetical protein MTR_2g086860 [Medicago truncatula]RHN75486.1 hypothetical protein MtrunA17_Chr2g0321771 [Medicago truncatula]
MSNTKSVELQLRPPSSDEVRSSVDQLPELVSSSIVDDPEISTKKDNKEHGEAVTKKMVLVGCQKCYMYVLSSEVEPKCPQCNTTVLLDLFK